MTTKTLHYQRAKPSGGAYGATTTTTPTCHDSANHESGTITAKAPMRAMLAGNKTSHDDTWNGTCGHTGVVFDGDDHVVAVDCLCHPEDVVGFLNLMSKNEISVAFPAAKTTSPCDPRGGTPQKWPPPLATEYKSLLNHAREALKR